MYFKNISYQELQRFHHQVTINLKIRLQDAITNGLFKVVTIGELFKIFSLFYTDRIESTNSNDKILDNQCIICENKQDTILYFISDETLPVLSLNYEYYSDFQDYIAFYLYDGKTSNSLYNVTAEFIFKENNEIIQQNTVNSDENGFVYMNTNAINYDELIVNFSIIGANKTFEWRND